MLSNIFIICFQPHSTIPLFNDVLAPVSDHAPSPVYATLQYQSCEQVPLPLLSEAPPYFVAAQRTATARLPDRVDQLPAVCTHTYIHKRTHTLVSALLIYNVQ